MSGAVEWLSRAKLARGSGRFTMGLETRAALTP